jgi:hypothetical protein
VGLPARQVKVLEYIECELQASDPKLAALYATFARLAGDEELPRIEELRHRVSQWLARLRYFAGRILSLLRFRRTRRARSAVLFFPLALAVLATSITLAVRSSSSPACSAVKSVATARNPGKTRQCSPLLPPDYLGRLVRA